MSHLPEIASLWIGGRLSFLEQLCLKSFVDRGHETTLYVYENVEGVPEGVGIKDAHEIFRGKPYLVHHLHGSPAIHADFFRVKLMKQKENVIWADTDAYCYKPFDFESKFVFGWLDEEVANGVMQLPQDSLTLKKYNAFLSTKVPIPPWWSKEKRFEWILRRKRGEKTGFEDMPWASTGPKALTHFLQETGEVEYAQKEKVFYPFTWAARRNFLLAPRRFMKSVAPETVSFHFYGRIVRRILAQEFGGLPKPGSMLDVLCREHGIDAEAAPIVWEKHKAGGV